MRNNSGSGLSSQVRAGEIRVPVTLHRSRSTDLSMTTPPFPIFFDARSVCSRKGGILPMEFAENPSRGRTAAPQNTRVGKPTRARLTKSMRLTVYTRESSQNSHVRSTTLGHDICDQQTKQACDTNRRRRGSLIGCVRKDTLFGAS